MLYTVYIKILRWMWQKHIFFKNNLYKRKNSKHGKSYVFEKQDKQNQANKHCTYYRKQVKIIITFNIWWILIFIQSLE